MKRWTRCGLMLLLPLLLSACGEGFPDEEMHLGLEDKVRPYAVFLSTPEVAPGGNVMVALYYYAPDPDEVDVTWQVALDYDRGLYGTDEIERQILPISSSIQTEGYDDNLMVQLFSWEVPDSVMRVSSALPEILTDPVLVALAEAVMGPEAGTPPTREGVESWIRGLPQGATLSPEVEALVDRFSCAIRFRATMRTDQRTVDVTRNLTVRYSSLVGSTQVNANNQAVTRNIVALAKADAETSDLDDGDIPREVFDLPEGQGIEALEIPYHEDWTYFLGGTYWAQDYKAPYEMDLVVQEELEGRWYYHRDDDPTAPEHFFLNDVGEEAEMWEMDDDILLNPAGSGSQYTLVTVVRDTRRDWAQYHLSPGLRVYLSTIRFVDP